VLPVLASNVNVEAAPVQVISVRTGIPSTTTSTEPVIPAHDQPSAYESVRFIV
jgi:hypothetical protein